MGAIRAIRVVLRSISVALLITAGVAIFPDVNTHALLLLSESVSFLVVGSFYLGYIFVAFLRDVALTTEEQWQRGERVRAPIKEAANRSWVWCLNTTKISLKIKPYEQATISQALTIKIITKIIFPIILIFVANYILKLRLGDMRDLLNKILHI